ncbi:MAG: preprotein translocase subunit SecE [Rickettsiales bacterium]|nr:preprotein translocase subunit SecE [Rickettsiales bacterium]
MKKIVHYIKDVRSEWFKIVWPNRDQVVKSSILIFVFSAVFAAFLLLTDSTMAAIVGWIF